MIHGDTDYALSRLQARAGQRLDAEQWRQISSTRSLAAVLEQLRAGSAAIWVGDIGRNSTAHVIEAQLRVRFKAQIEELAGWASPEWHSVLLWCARLVELPALRQTHGARSELQRNWPKADLLPFLHLPLVSAIALESAWLQEFARRLPALDADATTELSLLRRIVDQHRLRFSRLAAGNGWPERVALQGQLRARLRRNPLSPVHLLTAAALLLLDYERVRGELLRWAAMPPDSGP